MCFVSTSLVMVPCSCENENCGCEVKKFNNGADNILMPPPPIPPVRPSLPKIQAQNSNYELRRQPAMNATELQKFCSDTSIDFQQGVYRPPE